MESIVEIKEALSTRSSVTTLEDLRGEGRQEVKVIRAHHVARMISEAVRDAVDKNVAPLKASLADMTRQRDQALARVDELQAIVDGLEGQPAAAQGGASQDLIMKLMNQVAELKANMGQPAAQGAAGADLQAVFDKLSSSLDERLDKFGRKIGVSSAVEADSVNLEGLFRDDADQGLESNIDDIELKKKSEGGIASNLERLKKLKGGQ